MYKYPFYDDLIYKSLLCSLFVIGVSIFIDLLKDSNIQYLNSEKLENREETCYNDDKEI